MVVGQAVCSLEGQIVGSVDQYAAKPIGLMEWLSPTTKLSQLEYVHNCMKLGNDINLGLCLKTEANMKTIARTERDDRRDIDLKPEDILPSQTAATINYSSLMILIGKIDIILGIRNSFFLNVFNCRNSGRGNAEIGSVSSRKLISHILYKCRGDCQIHLCIIWRNRYLRNQRSPSRFEEDLFKWTVDVLPILEPKYCV